MYNFIIRNEKQIFNTERGKQVKMKVKTILNAYFHPIDTIEAYSDNGNFLFRCPADEEFIQEMNVKMFHVYETEEETILEVI